jgi:predicted transcriptional regulator
MACLTPDGTPGASALAILKTLLTAQGTGSVAQKTGMPLFRVRSGLRELVGSGLVRMDGDQPVLTDSGKAMVRQYQNERRSGEPPAP